MLIEKRTSLLSMTRITKLIRRMRHQHLLAFATVRIVTGGAGNFHAYSLTIPSSQPSVRPILSAEQVGRTLKQGLSYFAMASQARILDRKINQVFFG